MQYIRRPSHAGSWYSKDGAEIAAEVAAAIETANAYQRTQQPPGNPKDRSLSVDGVDVAGVQALLQASSPSAILGLYGPHAGLYYSANTNSHAYTLVEKLAARRPAMYGSVKRIFLIGPTHHKSMHMEVSGASSYTLPWGKGEVTLPCDTEVLKHIQSKAKGAGIACGVMDRPTDEAEHSLEMHLPFVTRLVQSAFKGVGQEGGVSTIKVVPMLFGSMSAADHQEMAATILGPYFRPTNGPDGDTRVENFFVFSTDFCHWGSRFGYTYHYDAAKYPVPGDSIKAMDLAGVGHLWGADVDGWEGYLRTTRNTICGRHPLSTMLRMVREIGQQQPCRVIPTHYSQSSKVLEKGGSSVSYASGVLAVDNTSTSIK